MAVCWLRMMTVASSFKCVGLLGSAQELQGESDTESISIVPTKVAGK